MSVEFGQRSSAILLVEDNEHDVFAVKRALAKAGVRNKLVHCRTGDELFETVLKDEQSAGAHSLVLPAIILLDLNLPGTGGIEVLKALKAHERLRSIPVIVFSSSNDERDIHACFEAGANSYVVKPMTFTGLLKAMGKLYGYWFEISVLPKNEN